MFLQVQTYNQLLVAWNKCFCTTSRQVSRLKDHHIRHLPSFPVIYRLQLPNYGDEFVQDLHLFPFSPKPMLISTHCFDTCMLLFNYSVIYHISYLMSTLNFQKSVYIHMSTAYLSFPPVDFWANSHLLFYWNNWYYYIQHKCLYIANSHPVSVLK